MSIKKHPQNRRFKGVLFLSILLSSKRNKSDLKAY